MKKAAILVLLAGCLAAEVCPFCANEKAKSRVFPGLCTLGRSYYDEAGKLHELKTCDFECSRGHLYVRRPDGSAGPQGDIPIQTTRAVQTTKGVARSPERRLTCTVNSRRFQELKEDLTGCQRGNCAGRPGSDALGVLAKFLETIECR